MDRSLNGNGAFKITLGFVLNVLITLTAIIISFVTLRNDTFNALAQIARQEAIIADQEKTIIDMRMAIQKVDDGLTALRYQYNEDMNKYVRERPK